MLFLEVSHRTARSKEMALTLVKRADLQVTRLPEPAAHRHELPFPLLGWAAAQGYRRSTPKAS